MRQFLNGCFGLLAALLILAGSSRPDTIPLSKNSSQAATQAYTEYKQGSERLKINDLPSAEKLFRASLDAFPSQVESHLGLADVSMRRKQYPAAQVQLDSVLKLAPNSSLVARGYGDLYRAEGKTTQAETAYKRAAQLDPKSATPLVDLGDMALNLNHNPTTAETYYRQAIKAEPTHSGAHYGLAMCLLARDNSEDAEAEMKTASHYSNNNPLPFMTMGSYYLRHSKADQAISDFSEASVAQPAFVPAFLARGDAYIAKGDDQHALADYQNAAKLAPKLGLAQFKIGTVYERKKNFSVAEQSYKTAIADDPTLVFAYGNLALLSVTQKENLDNALAWAQKAVALAPRSGEILGVLGWVYVARGQKDMAVAELKKAAALAPANPEIHYHLAIAYQDSGKLSEALAEMNKSLALKKDFPEAVDAQKRDEDLKKRVHP